MYSLEVKKIKISFLIFAVLIFLGFSATIFATENSSGENIVLDSDQDDLTDEEELEYGTDPKNPDSDGDGYSDGAEIRSGYDPLKPAPGDKLVETTTTTPATETTTETTVSSSTGNMTDDISNQIAAMIANSDGGLDGISMEKINSLIEESIASKISFSELPEIDESTIKILSQDYSEFSEEKQTRKKKEDNEEYLSAVFYILSNNLPHSIASEDDISSFSNEIMNQIPMVTSGSAGVEYFNDLAERGTKMIESLSEIEVPQDMLEMHKKALQLATYAVSLKEKVKVDNNDPLASIVSLSEVENLLTLVSDYLIDVEARLEELDLTGFITEQNL